MVDNGTTGGLHSTEPILLTIAAFTAIAWYNCVELNVMIWLRFKKHKGLYFWSLLVCSWGIVLHALSFLAKFFQVWKNDYVSVTIITIGWYAMVTGQSLVLYSRLHLVMHDNRKIKWVLYMIIIDVFLFHVPTTVLTFGANSSKAYLYTVPYSVMEKIQITAFCIQEFIISGLYVFHTRKILKTSAIFRKSNTRTVMQHLIFVNVLIILMDFTLLGTEFANHYEIETTYKSALYSIKLKLEFAVLNQLLSLTRSSLDSTNKGNSNYSYGRSGTDREVHFPTANQANESAKCYAVSASVGPPSRLQDERHDGYVMKTMDVEVTVSEQSGKIKDCPCKFGPTNDAGTKVKGRRMLSSPSPAESEVEFVNAGA
ncbi:hypothetical protein BKA61DRAFT_733566 [Leptodontidium sp. MPI-SDFR-AT-0119]|nr:hypothetical protein BKA61DRAFT_733566 [Leptodontidium sp. MPI-SDFR-AT-0119]